jgi:ribosomal protein L28
MRRLKAGWVTFRTKAAREKLPVSARALKVEKVGQIKGHAERA